MTSTLITTTIDLQIKKKMSYGQSTEQFDFDREILPREEDHDCYSSEEDGCDCSDRYLLEEIEDYDD